MAKKLLNNRFCLLSKFLGPFRKNDNEFFGELLWYSKKYAKFSIKSIKTQTPEVGTKFVLQASFKLLPAVYLQDSYQNAINSAIGIINALVQKVFCHRHVSVQNE